jgi:Transposase DDE domain
MAKLQLFNLLGSINDYLSTDQIKKILIIAFGISQSRSVNMNEVNAKILTTESGCKNETSQYVWLLKLFQTGNYEQIIKNCFYIIVVYFYGGQEQVQLVIDRTNWDLGSQKINLLTIGLLTKDNIFIPLVWSDLGYKGNSDSRLRLELIDQLLKWWKALEIPVPTFEICGDREFIGEYWLTELARRGVFYVIRLRGDLSFETWLNESYKVEKRFTLPVLHRHLNLYQKKAIEVVLQNESIAQVFVVANDGNDANQEPFLYFITNLDNIDSAGLAYRKRWKIEVFFKYMKTQGFHLEDFNMVGQHKVNIQMSLLSIVYLVVLELEAVEKAKLAVLEATQNAAFEARENAKSEGEKAKALEQLAAQQLKLEAQAKAQLAAQQLKLEVQAKAKLAAQKAKLEAQNKAQFKVEKRHLELETKSVLPKGERAKLEKQYQFRLKVAIERLEIQYQPQLEVALNQLKIEKKLKLEAQKVKLETKHHKLIDKKGQLYARQSDFIVGRNALAKIRVFQGFFDICIQISENLIHKLAFLKQLYINKSYA